MSVDHTISRFLASLGAGGTNESVDDVLKPCIKVETVLRNLWAKDRGNDALQNHYVGLVDVLGPDVPSDIRVTRRRHVKDEADLSAKHIFPLSDTTRRQDGEPSMVLNLEEFKNNWAIFSENSLSQLSDWNNVVVAGGSVLACLLPMDKEHKKTKRTLRKYFHGQAYSTSDVDVFLWGLNAEQVGACLTLLSYQHLILKTLHRPRRRLTRSMKQFETRYRGTLPVHVRNTPSRSIVRLFQQRTFLGPSVLILTSISSVPLPIRADRSPALSITSRNSGWV